MTVATWPLGLREPLIDGFVKETADDRVLGGPANGPIYARQSFSRSSSALSFSLVLTLDQVFRLDRFYQETLQAGTQPFTIENPRTIGVYLATEEGSFLTTEDGTPLTLVDTLLCLFAAGSQPEESLSPDLFRKSVTLLVLP